MTVNTNDPRAFIVLGGSGDIGSRVAKRLTNAGHHVLLAARGGERLDNAAAELQLPKQIVA